MVRPKNARCKVCGKQAHGRGILHLPSKRFEARFLAPDGKRHSRTFQTAKDAQAWLNRQFADISSDQWSKRDTLVVTTFGDYAKHWLANRKVKGRPIADRTREGYQDLLRRFILGTFAHQPIHTITRDEVEKWYDRTAVNTPTYRARAYSLLRTIMASAVDDGYLLVNPAKVRGAGSAPRRHQIRVLDIEELAALTAAMPPRYRALIQIGFWGGLRFGELTELRRSDVDTKRGVIQVRRAVVLANGTFIVKTTKSDAGVRDVLLPPDVMLLVRQHLLEHTAPGPDGLLFPSRNDPQDHLRQSSLTRVFYPARLAAGRPDFRFHDLRHTHLTMYAQAGATTAEIKARGGHSTSQAALRYQQVAQGREALIVAKLSAMITAAAAEEMTSPRPRGG